MHSLLAMLIWNSLLKNEVILFSIIYLLHSRNSLNDTVDFNKKKLLNIFQLAASEICEKHTNKQQKPWLIHFKDN